MSAETDVTFVRKSEIHITTSRGLVSFVELAVDGETAIFVSSHASGPTFIELVFPWYTVHLSDVATLELIIVPDKSGSDARASLRSFRVE